MKTAIQATTNARAWPRLLFGILFLLRTVGAGMTLYAVHLDPGPLQDAWESYGVNRSIRLVFEQAAEAPVALLSGALNALEGAPGMAQSSEAPFVSIVVLVFWAMRLVSLRRRRKTSKLDPLTDLVEEVLVDEPFLGALPLTRRVLCGPWARVVSPAQHWWCRSDRQP